MSDLVVSYDTLESSKSELSSIKSVFDGLEGSVNDASSAWGDHDVSDAMNEFATNWGYHRAKMSDLIKSGCEKLEKTMSTFEKADHDTAHALDQSVQVNGK